MSGAMTMDRRKFLASLSVGSLGLMGLPNAWAEDSNTPVLFPVPTNTGITGKVVVVGGGSGTYTYTSPPPTDAPSVVIRFGQRGSSWFGR